MFKTKELLLDDILYVKMPIFTEYFCAHFSLRHHFALKQRHSLDTPFIVASPTQPRLSKRTLDKQVLQLVPLQFS